MTSRTRSAASAVALLLATTAAAPAFAQAPNAEARTHLAAAQKASFAKDWNLVASEAKASLAAQRTAAAALLLASALYELKKPAEAYDAYDAALTEFGKSIDPASRKKAEERRTALEGQTGLVTLTSPESGAEIRIDGTVVGTTPIAKPLRLSQGPHVVVASKDGFAKTERSITVGAAAQTVDLALQKTATKARLVVKAKGEGAARVLIDGVDVGPAPWEGDVDPGGHEVVLRSSKGASAPQRFDLAAGDRKDVELEVATAVGRLEIATSDRLGAIAIDGAPVGEGVFAGDLPVGAHVVKVTREGFEPQEKTVEVRANTTLVETITLKTAGGSGSTEVADEEGEAGHGLYGGLGLPVLFQPGGSGSEPELRCTELGAASCDGPNGFGTGLFGYVGYAWSPIGIELMLAGQFDQQTVTAKFSGTGGGNPLLVGVARDEDFAFRRFGGLGALRARAIVENDTVRGTLAAGFGIAVRAVVMSRDATATDGSNLEDTFIPDPEVYVSPALTLDGSFQFKLSRTTGLGVGALAWFETAGQDVRSEPDGTRVLTEGDKRPVPIATPTYRFASSTQIFVGPYIALQFGP